MPATAAQAQTLNTRQMAEALTMSVHCQQPTIVWGAPGIGKSDLVRQIRERIARDLVTAGTITHESQYRLIDLRAAMLDAVDVHGLPTITEEDGRTVVKWIVARFFPRDGYGIIFLDELNRAPVTVMNALLQLVLDRRIGDYVLPDGYAVLSACNRETDGGGVQRMTAALKLRFEHDYLAVDLDEWCRWAVQNDVHPVVYAYNRFATSQGKSSLHDFKPEAPGGGANPRSWASVSKLMHFVDKMPKAPSHEILSAKVCGLVGEEYGIAFMGFRAMFAEMPNIDHILIDPTGVAVPTDVQVLYCVAATLATRATMTTFENVATFAKRMGEAAGEEFMVMCVRDAVRRKPELTGTPTWNKWFLANQSLFS
jgi:hypothetical protein